VPEKKDKSRLEELKVAGKEPEVPPVTASYLVAYLFEVGPTFPGAMGSVGLPWREIESWQRQIGIDLQPWEARLIRHASIEYANQAALSTKADCASPLKIVVTDPMKIAKHIKNILRG
jgi:hypothetical protein